MTDRATPPLEDTRLLLDKWILKKQVPFFHRSIKTMFEKLSTPTARTSLEKSLSASNRARTLSEPEVGDLVLAKCDLNFIENDSFMIPREYFLPPNLEEQFKATGPMISGNSEICARDVGFTPVLFLDVFLDISLLGEITEEDYDQSQTETKLWDFNSSRGFLMKDYVRVQGSPASNSILSNYVEFFSFSFKDNDIVAEIPSLFETRKEKFWFYSSKSSNIYRNPSDTTKERLLKMPVVGVCGTLLDTKTLVHARTDTIPFVKGNTHTTTLYKILFNSRVPLWVDSVVVSVREEDKLDLPIYLPVL